MSTIGPFLAIALALIAAGSIAYIAWELSSDDFHQELEDGSRDDSLEEPADSKRTPD
jgi:hypothetical protein